MKYIKNLKELILKYRHGFVLSYFFIYLAWFTYLERTVTDNSNFNVVYSRLDDLIPFMEIFVVPYFLWFAYIFVTVAYFFLTSKQDFYRICAYLFIGMTICLIIYTVWPNGHKLRVDLDSLGRSNLFIDIMDRLYNFDTATNVFPSIHVFNSIGAMIAIYRSERLRKMKALRLASFILTISICLSTVFLKQHSVLDIYGGVALGFLMYLVVYVPSWGSRVIKTSKQEEELSKVS